MIELTLLKILMLTRQVHQKSVLFVTIFILLDKGFEVQPSVCNCCHDVLMMPIDLKVSAILNI